jgi:energy-coupling factor transport system permease protein
VIARPIDPRAWLLWAAAATVPPLVGRNPFVLLATTLAVLGVWAAWRDAATDGWGRLLRLGALFALVGVLFNTLTAHVGDRPFARLPDAWPLVGGPLTVNALVYGLLSGLAVFGLLLVGTTLGATLDWATLLRLLPDRLHAVAVTGAVAWALVPQTLRAFGEIREAQEARGHRLRSPADAGPLLVPLLAGSLERSQTLAEALEARGFGAALAPQAALGRWRGAATAAGLTLATVGAYGLAMGSPAFAFGGLGFGVGALWAAGRERGGGPRRTCYREPAWDRRAWLVAGSAGVVLGVEVAILAVQPAAFAYDPYPSMLPPAVSLSLLAALGLLLVPAAIR